MHLTDLAPPNNIQYKHAHGRGTYLSSAGRPSRAGGDQLMLMLQSVTLETTRSRGAPGTASSKLRENFPLAPVS